MKQTISTENRTFLIQGEAALEAATVKKLPSADPFIDEYDVTFTFGDISKAAPVRVQWHEPMEDMLAYWSVTSCRNTCIPQGWYPNVAYACMLDGLPLFSMYRLGGENYRTVAVSEYERQVWLSMCVNNDPQNDDFTLELTMFREVPPPKKTFSLTLRVDSRALPMTQTVRETSLWLQSFGPNPPTPETLGKRPAFGKNFAGDSPLFSSWYACMQDPRQKDLEAALPGAEQLGFKSMILDDGWSYDGKGTGDYRLCGSWSVSKTKFPDMRAFVDRAHAAGIRLAFWFPFPYVGRDDPHYETFRDKLLGEEGNAGLLDPRFPDVRRFIIDSFVGTVKEYGLDGLKLDFLSSFNRLDVPARPGTDVAEVNDGVRLLLRDLDKELKKAVPDGMIEFRLNYLSPTVMAYCNMVRVGDCANDFVTNRVNGVMLRLLSYPAAVHADMLLWKQNDTPGNVAVMMQNVMFTVPQISVMFQNIAPAQWPVIKCFNEYWTAHRDLLLYAPIRATDPQAMYSSVWVEDDDLKILALYENMPVTFTGKTTDVFMANRDSNLFAELTAAAHVTVFAPDGKILHCEVRPAGVCKIAATPGARIHFEKQ